MAEQPTNVPIVERFPNNDNPYPRIDENAPTGTVGHPDAALEHEPIEYDGKIVAAPVGHGVQVVTTPSEQQVEEMVKEGADTSDRWLGGLIKRRKGKEELPKAA
ncbi:hypothetical protein HYZ78_03675 [Candidatus Microgenomates bacterium]|nr:hypothetical protein [Candidatus Microgenomates bacterium]